MVKKIIKLTFLFLSVVTYAQQVQLEGTVTSVSDGQPMFGVSVVVKGESQGVQTDFDGNYSISVDKGKTLVFSYVGMLTAEVVVGDTFRIDIALEQDESKLDEVIITGYSTQSKKTLSAAVSVVSSEELVAVPIASAAQGLQGRVPGVTVGSGSGPGGGVSVRIRGYTTINNNDPLYVVDGMPLQGDINLINPNDIDSVSVLKDASASIYGARAASGVILITTKKGKSGESKLNYYGYYGVQNNGKLFKNASPIDQAKIDYIDTNARGIAPNTLYGGGTSPVLKEYLSGDSNIPYNFDTNRLVKANKEGTHWMDEIFNPAPIQSHQLTASGGNENGDRYLFSAGYFSQDGILLDTGYDRFSARVNTSFKVKDYLTIGESMTAAYYQRKGYLFSGGPGGPVSMAYRMSPIIPVYDEGGNYSGTGVGGLGNAKNPVAALNRRKDDKNRSMAVFGSAFAEAKILEGLKFRTNIGVSYISNFGSAFLTKEYENSENIKTNGLTETSFYNLNVDWYNTLTYSKIIDKHDITAMAGYELINDVNKNSSASRNNYPYENEKFKVLDSGVGNQTNSGNISDYGLVSYFGKLDYVFADKYILAASLRYDSSSRFVGDKRSAIFPAVSTAWKVSEEPFFESVKSIINDMKIRLSWGELGGQGIGNRYPTYNVYASGIQDGGYSISGGNNSSSTGYYSSKTGNPNIGWEISTVIDFGLDLQLFDNKLDIVFDLYERRTNDILYNPDLPATAGIQSDRPYVNIGDMNNTGFDFLIGYGDKKNDFGYDISLNVSAYKNTVERISDNDKAFINGVQYRDIFPTRTQKGQPISSFYGYIVDGVFKNQAEVDAHAKQDTKAIGRYKFRDIDGDNEITEKDRDFIGSPHPDFTYGLNLKFDYKNFDLTMFFQGSQGNKIFNATTYFTDFFTFIGGKAEHLLTDSFSTSNPNGRYAIPINDASIVGFEKNPSTLYVEDGSFVRMRNLQLGYNLPSNILESIGLESVKIYAQAQNLFTITNYTGLDPDISSQSFYSDSADLDIGVDRGIYPNSRTYLLGLNIGL